MKNVLRTAVGSPVAPFVINELKKAGCRVVGVDIDPISCGFLFTDAHEVISRVTDKYYLENLLKLCQKYKIDIFIPDLDEELELVAQNICAFNNIGVKVMLSDLDAIKICTDKWRTYKELNKLSIPVPKSWDLDTVKISSISSFPLIIKPKKGRGSQGIEIFREKSEITEESYENYIAQEFIEGTEYTIDVMNDFEGNYHYCSIRERIATDSGISIKGRTVRHDRIEQFVKKASTVFRFKGPTCFQCMESEDGKLGFIEINPRIAGSAALSILAGAPIIKDSIDSILGYPISTPDAYRFNVTMIRYWEQRIIEST